MDLLFNAGEVTYSQAAWFVLSAADRLPVDETAFDTARKRNWLTPRSEAGRPARLGEVSLLIMKSFGLKGGLMYRLFPNPRYACRELVHLKIIQGKNDPGIRVEGYQFLHILGRVLTYTGEEDALAAEETRRLLEYISESLRDVARQGQYLSSGGTEGIGRYEELFQLE
jgi:hypothetical protein